MADEHESKLGRDVFLALAALGWADGTLDENEADAIVRTALEEGLDLDEIAQIEQATTSPVSLEQIDIGNLSKADRLFVYAVGTWMAELDGAIDSAERSTLDKLGDLLRIPARPREHAAAIAREIGARGEGAAPALFDLPRLRRTLQVRLKVAQQMRAAGLSDPPPRDGAARESSPPVADPPDKS